MDTLVDVNFQNNVWLIFPGVTKCSHKYFVFMKVFRRFVIFVPVKFLDFLWADVGIL